MTEEKQARFKVSIPTRLNLGNVHGSVEVQPGEEGEIFIRAVKRPGSGDLERTLVQMSQAEDGEVTVRTEYEGNGRRQFKSTDPCPVDYTVYVPRTCVLRINCVSSTIAVRELKGAFDLKSVSGAVSLQQLSGRIKVGTVSGNCSGQELRGEADINAVSSGVQLGPAEFETIAIGTVSGDVELRTALGEGPHRLKTVSGQVRLTLPAGTGCSVEFSSLSGRLIAPQAPAQKVGRTGQLELGGGGPRLRFSSVSGDLEIGVEQAAAETEPAAPTQAPRGRTRLEVLNLISRGEISAEEGLVAIRDLKRAG